MRVVVTKELAAAFRDILLDSDQLQLHNFSISPSLQEVTYPGFVINCFYISYSSDLDSGTYTLTEPLAVCAVSRGLFGSGKEYGFLDSGRYKLASK
jgi:hypothetical protein